MAEDFPTRALTLWQPWAWLVASGIKPIENRPRGFSFKSFRGSFWIHAGAGSRDTAERVLGEQDRKARELCLEIIGRDPIPALNTLDYGAIIGRAVIVDCVSPRMSILGKPDPRPEVPWHFPDQYGFVVTDARLLKKPIVCRGSQGFWTVPPTVLEKLRAA